MQQLKIKHYFLIRLRVSGIKQASADYTRLDQKRARNFTISGNENKLTELIMYCEVDKKTLKIVKSFNAKTHHFISK